MNKPKITICYSRLSRGDANPGESGSIKNQRDILQDYAEKNGLLPTVHISDDDESGTGWNRPGWQELMSEVEAGNVGTILLKTLDRMGRDHLRVGLLLEQFRDSGIRLIAVSEGIDTDKGEDDFTPIRTLFAEWYARDCSRKIRQVFKNRMANGKRCSGAIPYGYLPNNGDVNDLIIDETAAVVVRRIFRMIIDGKGVNDIARTLMGEQIPIPSEHWKRIGQPYRSIKYADPYGWTPTTVSYIVTNPSYKGTAVLGKTQNSSYKGKKAVKTSAEQQYVFENALPVVVEPEVWENAQRLKKTVRRAPKSETAPNPLTGLLYCADCGAKLTHRHSGYDNAYCCSAYRKGIRNCCTMHYISVKNIEKILLSAIRRVVCYVRDNDGDFIEKVRAASVVQAEKSVKESKAKLTKSKRRTNELDGLIKKLFEDNASGKIPDKHFERMFADYDAEQTALETQIAELQTAIDAFNEDGVRADKFIDLALRYTEFPELTARLLNEFVSRVEIHEKDKSGERVTQEVDICFNFIGNFTVPEDYDELTPKERAALNAERERLDRKNAYEKERRERKKQLAERTPEEIAADEAEKYQRRLEYNRKYSREWARRKAAEKKAAAQTGTVAM
ncbi:MAG: recombinase family protein [Clostridiales Family XIII bacterium]|jgi:DNA invertase Pin-like site-specific DNA recombinase|nr:recombinase family protein [Clostridiales Family XIII bacterium]